MATELELNGQVYRIGRLTTMTQLYVTKRLTPIVLGIVSSMGAAQDIKSISLTDLVGPLGGALTQLTDDDLTYVIGACLGVVQIKQGTAFYPVWSTASKQPTYDDIELPQILRLVVEVVKGNLAGFTTAFQALQPSADPQIAR